MRNSCARATSSALGSLAAAIVAVALAARADSTIDFEASVPDTLYQQGYGSGQGAYLEDGFVIAEAAQGFWFMGANPERDAIGNGADGGSKHLMVPVSMLDSPANLFSFGIGFEREDQLHFSVHSLRLSEYSEVFPFRVTVQLVGIQEGGVVEQVFTTDGVVDGTGGLSDFELVGLDPDLFSNLLRFEILGLTVEGEQFLGFSVDDVVYSGVVPEPASAWLLALGLGLLCIIRSALVECDGAEIFPRP